MTAATFAPARFRRIAPLIAPLLITIGATATLTLLGHAMRGAGDDYHTPAWALWIHLATVIPAVPLGAWVLWGPKGTRGHKAAGRVWALMMVVTAIDSFWIRGLTGGIGPIHIFSVLTLVSIPLGIFHVRRGNVAAHRRAMTGVYIGLFVAGGFAMMPGRLLWATVFG